MTRKYFGTDGVRGKVGEYPITPEFVLKLGWAAGKVLGGGPGNHVLIGKDTRISGYMFEGSLEAGLSAAGMNVRLLGVTPTPAIAYLTRTFHARAGVVISASHNAYQDNGIKFFSHEGNKLPDEVELQIEAELDKPMKVMPSSQIGKVERIEDARGRYIEFCKSTISLRIALNGMKIVLDCSNGAAYYIGPHVFTELGANVTVIGNDPDGLNINDGCGATSPQALQQAVLANQADVGIALDGDADRLIMVDSNGAVVDGDEILYIIAESRYRARKLSGAVVGTLMSNLGLEKALAKLGVAFQRAKVGDRYIMEMLHANDGMLGGESSGHIICLDKTTTGDGIVSALQVLAAMYYTEQPLHMLKSKVQKYPQRLVNVPITGNKDVMSLPEVQKAVREVEGELADTGRVLLRPSGTEPLIRVMVEGSDANQVETLSEQLAADVREAATG